MKVDMKDFAKDGTMESFVFWECFSEIPFEESENILPEYDPDNPCEIDIEFKVNGKELNFRTAMDRLHEQLNKMIEQKAKDLLSYHLGTLSENIEQKFSELIGN